MKMKKIKVCLSLLLSVALLATTLIVPMSVSAADTDTGVSNTAVTTEDGKPRRSIGYLPGYRGYVVDQIDYEKLDYVILSFLRYTDKGWETDWTEADAKKTVELAHAAGAKVFVAIGGGGAFRDSLPFWNESNREYVANCIFDVVDKYDLDGIDMDAETDDIKFWQGYHEFVDLLRIGADARGIELSMAVHPWFTELIENEEELYEKYDFLNIMSYDFQGDRSGGKPGISTVDHAPVWHATQLLDHYTNKGVAPEKLNVGVPFYYYIENGSWGGAVTYGQVVADPNMNIVIETLPGESKLDAWRRGIEQKAHLGGEKYGGVFTWELGHDNNYGSIEDRLLTIMYDAVKGNKPLSTPIAESEYEYPEILPSPYTDLPIPAADPKDTTPDLLPGEPSVKLTHYWWNANVGQALKINVLSNKGVTWVVRDVEGADKVASVDANGVVTALGEGCAVIGAMDGTTRLASVNVKVTSKTTEDIELGAGVEE